MVNVDSTAQTLSDDYAALGNWIGLATANQQGSSGPFLEVPAGAAGYGRIQTTWNSIGGGVNNGKPVTLSAPAGEYTFVHFVFCADRLKPAGRHGNRLLQDRRDLEQ